MTTAPRLTIDLSAIARNWQTLAKRCASAETAAVVKANAYGLGIEAVVPVLSAAGCGTFFVAMLEEGVRVRAVAPDATIYVLNGIVAESMADTEANRLFPVLSTPDQIRSWAKQGQGRLGCAIQVDTGMNRLGLSNSEAVALSQDNALLEASGARSLMSHFACADDPEHPLNGEQKQRFEQLASCFPGLRKSLANSAAVLSDPESHHDLTRPGIAIYGGEAVNDTPNPMVAVATAEARIVQIRHAAAGETVGYGGTHTLSRPSRIAICSAGYADGYHRASSGSGVPLRGADSTGGMGAIKGQLVPVIGRVSMDLTAFDVTDVPDRVLEKAEWIELFGTTIALDDAARACGTIGYELLTSLGQRYQRRYVTADG